MWPTSELPIWPSGSPTSMPEPEISVRGAFAHRRSHTGVLAAIMALESGDSLYPKPSRIINTTGLGAAVIRLLAVVEEVRETAAGGGRHAGKFTWPASACHARWYYCSRDRLCILAGFTSRGMIPPCSSYNTL